MPLPIRCVLWVRLNAELSVKESRADQKLLKEAGATHVVSYYLIRQIENLVPCRQACKLTH